MVSDFNLIFYARRSNFEHKMSGTGTGESQWGQLAPTTFHRARNPWAVVLPKVGVVGHKGKLNGREHFSKKFPSFISSAAHLAD